MTDLPSAGPSDDMLSIAIVGMAGRFPDAADIGVFWERLAGGVECIRRYDAAELAAHGIPPEVIADPDFVPVGAFLEDIDRFDAAFFGFTPRDAELTDPQQRLFLETAWQALEHAGQDPARFPGPVGVFGGAFFNGYFFHKLARNSRTLQAGNAMQLTLGNSPDFLCGRVAYQFGLRGPAVTVQTACSTSLVAVHMACQSLLAGECDMALAGGVSVDVNRVPGYRYTEGDIRSRDGHCRAFDAMASGTLPGSGVGVVVLKTLARARTDGDTVYAVIRGSAINNDGANRVGFTAPSVEGQAAVIAEALGAAGVAAEEVSYVEAHGTATALGDPIEFNALRRIYGAPRAGGQPCAIGSVKTNIGHLDAAAGVAGLIKTVLALRHRQIPASLHFTTPNPHMDLDGCALTVAARTAPWPQTDGAPRRAGVSSFGLGGTNAHVVLEEAPPQTPDRPAHPRHLLLLSAKTQSALDSAAANLSAFLAANPETELADAAFTSQVGRARFPWRRALVCADIEEARRRLDEPAPADAAPDERAEDTQRVMFMFPGQGAQHLDMGRPLYDRPSVFRDTLDNCAAVLEPMLGLDLRALLYPAPGEAAETAHERLNRTSITQPALFAVEYALARQWQAWGIEPAGMIGHSIGEYVAACLAGVMSLADALRIVATRGTLVERLAGEGVMLAVHTDEATLRPLLGENLWLAAVNGPAACSVSGTREAIAGLASALDAHAIGHQPLATSHAFHSGLLDPVLGAFRRAFDSVTLHPPRLPFVSNVTGDWITPQQAADPGYWVQHLRATVLFAKGLETLMGEAPCILLEVGPGRALCGLVKASRKPRQRPAAIASLPHRSSGASAEATMPEALGALWRHGVDIDWRRYYGDERRQRIALPSYPFERRRYWIEAEPTVETAAPRSTRRHAGRRDDIGGWFYAPSWRRGTGAPPAAPASAGTHLLLVDRAGRARPLVDRLRAQGEAPIVVRPGKTFAGAGDAYILDPTREEHYTALFEALQAAGQSPARITHLWSLARHDDDAAVDPAEGVHSLHALARALGRLGTTAPVTLTIVANGIHAVTGEETLLPDHAALAGPCRVIPLEYPNIACRLIDIETRGGAPLGPLTCRLLCEELAAAPDSWAVVALRGMHRWTQTVEPVRLDPPAAPALKPGGHYLIIGGAGGIGSLFAEHVARTAPGARLTLIGRTALPAAERIRDLESLGAEVSTIAADIADRAQMEQAAATAQARFGAPDGFFHAAAVAGGKRIADETPETTERLFAPKVAGLRVLDEVFDLARADVVVLCSSLAAFAPIDGQSTYCAANAFVDAFAQRLRLQGANAIAVNWNTWQGVGMARRIAVPEAFRDQLDLYLSNGIAAADGPTLFERVLVASLPQVIVTPVDFEAVADGTARLAQALRGESVLPNREEAGTAPDGQRPTLATSYAPPSSALEQALAAIWQTEFGIGRIGIHDDFFDLGGHSLLAVQIVAKTRQALAIDLPLRALFDAPTVAGLANAVDRLRAANAPASPADAPITPRAEGAPAPLSFAQQRLWLLAQIEGASAAYHMPAALRLHGALDVPALQWAFARVMERHEALRTVFAETDVGVVQRILPTEGFTLGIEDRPDLAHDTALIARIAGEEAAAPFDLATGPLIRARLLRLAERDHLLLVTMHHIVSDGWSMTILTRELGTLYQSRREDKPDPLPALPVQYADYAAWQRTRLAGEALREHADYWRRTLDGAPALLDLPTDRPRPQYQDHTGAVVDVAIDAPLASQLAELARRHGVTTYMALLAGWAIVLSRLAGQHDIVIGTPTANRSRSEVEGLIGFFINTLAMRVDLSGAPSIGELFQRVKALALEGQAHQDLPFEQVVEILKPERNPSHSPVFQTMLAWQAASDLDLDLGGLDIGIVRPDRHAAKFDLLLDLRETGGRIAGALEYASALFDASTARRLVDSLVTVLGAMTRDDTAAVDTLPLVGDAELKRLTTGFSREEPRYAQGLCVHRMFEAQAGRTPDAVAVTGADGRLTYAQLDARASRLAHRLHDAGVRPGARVAICAGRSVDMIAGVIAVLKAGGAYVPLDPSYPAERLAFMLADSAPAAILAEPGTYALVAGAGVPILRIAAESADETGALPDADPDGIAYVIYTSGSTGRPKGVAMPHGALANLIHWQIDQHAPGRPFAARTLQYAAIGFDVSFQEIFGTLCSGGALHLVDADLRFDFPRLFQHLCAEKIERLYLPYVALQGLAEAVTDVTGCTLRDVIVAGEQLRITPAIAAFFAALPGCRLHNHYGPTESHVVTAFTLPDDVSTWPTLPVIGHALPNTRLYVLDTQRQPVPVGMPGEIYIGGAQVARGYFNQDGLTAERFLPDPFAGDERARMYRTGDVGRWHMDGRLDYLGRNDEQVKLRGFRVEPGEIEAALAALPGVREAVVALRETPGGDRRLIAWFTSDAAAPGETVLREALSHALPDYMVPAHFVRLEHLPLTPSGKVDRRALPAPDFDAAAAHRAAHASPTEELLAGIWREVLAIPHAGADDNFFALGGHSLLATRVISKIRTAFAVDLPIRALFEDRTLRDLARRIDDTARERSGTALPAIVARRHDAPPPLSFAQQRLWFIDQLERGSPLYNIPVAVQLTGHLDLGALARAFEEIIARHAALRTSFAEGIGGPVQVIADAVPLPMPVHDLSALPPEAREARVEALAAQEARLPFDLAAGPLLRVSVIALGGQEHVLLLTVHHIVSDGWSIGVLVREFAALYTAFVEGRPSPLPPLALQYADFSAWQREWLAGSVLERQLGYWTDTLRDAPALIAFPTDRPRGARRGYRGEQVGFTLDAGLTAAIRALAGRTQTTLFMVLMAAFDVLLARYSGEDDICVGTAIANRNRAEIEPLIGLFVNTLVIRARIDPLASFETLLGHVRTQALNAYANQDVPFEQVVDALAPARSLSHQALFQMMLIVQNTPMEPLAMPGLRLHARGNANATAKCDLLINIAENEREGILACGIEYDADLFDAATVERIGRHFTELLRQIVLRPEAPIASLRLADAAEAHRMLAAWNDTARHWPDEADCITRFEAQAAATPERTAIIFEDRRLTYRELDRRAGEVAAALLARGIGREDRVGILCARSAGMMVAVLGAMKAGAAWVPLDPDAGAARLAFIARDAAPKLILTQRPLREAVPPSDAEVLCVDEPGAFPAPLPADTLQARRGRAPDSLAYLIYTSGSTGVPKAVAVTQRGLSNLLHTMQERPGIVPDDTMLSVTSLAFDLVIPNLFLPLMCGAATVYAPRALTDDPEHLAGLMERHDVSFMQATPATWRMLAEHRWPRLARPLRLLCGGEALSVDLAEKLLAHVPVVWNMYGPTETTVWSTTEPVESPASASCIGRPLANTAIYLLDGFGNPVPVGATGELHIGGDGLARGYLGRAALTAERFVPDPVAGRPGARMYRTGDHARFLVDGRIEYLGRVDNQLKLRGFRIEAGEIETTLAAQPGIRETVVLTREIRTGDIRLVAYVVLEADAPADRASWRGALAAALPDYMVPAHFVVMDALPLTWNGKLDRRALPLPDEAASGTAYAEPETLTERTLAGLWAELLNTARIGRHDNFFEAGGHSLLATRLVSRLRQGLGIELPLSAVFEAPTLAALARRIEAAEPDTQAAPIPHADRGGPLPLSFAQQRLWFLDRLQPGNPAYHVPIAARLEGALDLATLRATFETIVARHETLRTSFATEDGVPVQRIAESIALPFEVVALDMLPPAERDKQVRALTRQTALAPFDLASGPLLRVRVLRLAADSHVAVVVLHHIVSDGWSLGILLNEIAEIYAALAEHRPPALAPLPVQYADFAAWQRRLLDRDTLHAQTAYWREQLAGAPKLIDLPLDRPRPAVQHHHGATHDFSIPAATTAALNIVGQREQATLFMTLEAAFRVLLSRYSGQTDICIGTPIANRPRAEIEPLIGLFINTLVLRTPIDPRASFTALLRDVRTTALAAYAHQDVPFEQVVDALDPERDLSHTPLFQVLLVLQNAPRTEISLPGLALRAEPAVPGAAKFDLSLYVTEADGRLNCTFEYATDLFEEGTIARMAGHLARLLDAVAADPARAVDELPMLGEAERVRVLEDWNATAADYPREATVHALFERQAAATPDAPAVSAGGESLTYAALNARANRLAHRLRALGARPGAYVAICLDRSVDMVAGVLAVLKSGAAYVPLDPAYPAERLAYMLADSAPAVLLTEESVRARLPEAGGAAILCIDSEPLDREPDTNPTPAARARDLAYAIYTSGSTGRPKGVMVPHRGVVNFLAAIARRNMVRPHDTLLSVTTLSFDIAVLELFAPLLCGARVVLAPRETAADPARLHALIETSGATVMQATPVTWRVLAEHGLPERAEPLSILCGGEALPPDLAARLLEHAPSIWNLYGPTETTIWSTACRIGSAGERIGIGRPLDNTSVYLLDERGAPVPVGVRGEVYIGGDGVARGYLGRPGLTAERFLPDPFAGTPGARMYRTGDLARYGQDGTLEHLGRIDTQVKLRGFRIEPGEIEATLAGQPGVRACVVVVRDQRLVAYVVPEVEGAGEAGEWRAALAAVLPDYMVPAHFVVLDALPLTPNGKIDRNALPAPAGERSDAAVHVPATTPFEQRLARIWSDVLKTDRVGAHDNFFALGGDSILSIQVAERARRAGLVLAPPDLFRAPTVAGLARLAEQNDTVHAEQGVVTGPVPLTPAQRHLLAGGGARAVRIVAFDLAAPLDPDALAQALAALVAHHDALRLQFSLVDGQWTQWHAVPSPETLLDCAGLGPETLDFRTRMLAESVADLHYPTAPRFRAGHYRLGPDRARLVLAAHTLVLDAASWPVVLADLRDAYAQCVAGREVLLPLKTTSFKQWAEDAAQRHPGAMGAAAWPEGVMTAGQTIDIGDQRALLTKEAGTALLEPVARALAAWKGTPEVAFDVALRATPRPPLDLSRTAGCLTAMQPVGVCVEAGEDQVAVRAKIRAYLDAPATPTCTAAVCFGHVQALADLLGEADNFGTLVENTGGAPMLLPPYDLAIEATLDGTRLMLKCAFRATQVEPASADALLSLIAAQLRTSLATTEPAPVPRAFDLTTLDANELADLVEEFGDEEDAPHPNPAWM